MTDEHFELATFTATVVEVKGGSAIAVGLASGPLENSVVIGRDADVDFRLNDRSVSRQHLRVQVRDGLFEFESLSSNGTTFIQGEALEFGERRLVDPDQSWVQVGRVLLRFEPFTDTLPVSQAIPIPNEANDRSLIAVRDGAVPEVWLGGEPVSLFPQAARMLRALAASPRSVLTYDELGRAIDPDGYLDSGGTNYAQLATYIRNVLAEAIENGRLEVENDPRDAARRIVKNVRGVGYALEFDSVRVLSVEEAPPRSTDDS